MARVHFLTFADGSPQYRAAARRLHRQAEKTGLFKTVTSCSFDALRKDYPAFWQDHGAFILRHKRGAGYWLWKPFLIAESLKRIPESDFLVYSDAGCEITPGGSPGLIDLLPSEPDFDITVVPLEREHSVSRWTNGHCLGQLGSGREIGSSPIIAATFLFIRNNEKTRNLVSRWLHWCTYRDHSCLVDRPGEVESDDFEEHRHDQSILTLLLYDGSHRGDIRMKLIGVEATKNLNFPIVGVRNISRFSMLSRSRLSRRILNKADGLLARIFGDERAYIAKLRHGISDRTS